MPLVLAPESDLDPAALAGRRVTIVGLGKGRTAVPLARYLRRAGARVTITDAKPARDLGAGLGLLGGLDVALVLAPATDDEALADADVAFVIPGIRPDARVLERAVARGIPLHSEVGLFLQLCRAPVVGVTGTKGKTTTTTLVGRLLERTGRRVHVGGNIGNALIDEVDGIAPDDLVVLELSSFQLARLGRAPHVAVVTMVGDDHLDVHGSRRAYVDAKRNIVARQRRSDVAVLNLDDPATAAFEGAAPSAVRHFSLRSAPARGAYLDGEGRLALVDGDRVRLLCAASELRIPGRHNVANALAAAIVGDLYGVDPATIAAVLRSFEGVPHRQEPVGESGGVLYVNNSQGTTPGATATALASYARPAVTILGGRSKGSDFTELARALVSRGRAAVLIGEAAPAIAAALEDARRASGRSDFAIVRAAGLEEAVASARGLAHPGDVVLLSPACASFDMFDSYEERGDRFRALVRRFAGPVDE